MSAIVQWIYNLWMQIPAGVRGGVTALVVAAVTLGLAFGWHFPGNWADITAQVSAFWLVAAPILWGIFQKSVWPPLFEWILVLLGLTYGFLPPERKGNFLVKVA